MRKKSLLSVLLALAIALTLQACASDSHGSSSSISSASSISSSSDSVSVSSGSSSASSFGSSSAASDSSSSVANTYVVTLDADGGELDNYTLTVRLGEEYSFPTPTKDAHTFLCWTYDGEEFPATGTWEISDSVTLKAMWKRRWSGKY